MQKMLSNKTQRAFTWLAYIYSYRLPLSEFGGTSVNLHLGVFL